jgi:hypothetical protein
MYCNNCGKHNPEDSKFCQYCGKKIVIQAKELADDVVGSQTSPSQQTEHTAEKINPKEPPYPYVISTTKFAILSVATLGIYEVYWFYKQWKSLKAERNLDIGPLGRAIFAPFFSFSFFNHISELGEKYKKIPGRWLAAAYFALVVANRIPEVGWVVASFSFLPLIPAQNAFNNYWNEKFEERVQKSGFGVWEILITIVGIGVILLAIYGTSLPEDNSFSISSDSNSQVTNNTELIQEAVKEAKSDLTLPYQVDEITTLVDMTAEPNSIRYHYVLSGADTENLTNSQLKTHLRSGICGNEDTRSLLQQGINMEYSYSVNDRTNAYFVVFDKSDCLY